VFPLGSWELLFPPTSTSRLNKVLLVLGSFFPGFHCSGFITIFIVILLFLFSSIPVSPPRQKSSVFSFPRILGCTKSDIPPLPQAEFPAFGSFSPPSLHTPPFIRGRWCYSCGLVGLTFPFLYNFFSVTCVISSPPPPLVPPPKTVFSGFK